jgi:hypothetical protein
MRNRAERTAEGKSAEDEVVLIIVRNEKPTVDYQLVGFLTASFFAKI